MSASPTLIFGLSRPTKVPPSLWIEWYVRERFPDLVDSRIATRVLLYQHVPFPGLPPVEPEYNFLVLVQTDSPLGHDDPRMSALPNDSTQFREHGVSPLIMDNAYAEVRDYELIQDYWPEQAANYPPAQLMTIEMQPTDEEDFENWYKNEHIPLLSRMPGYHRTTRYRWQAKQSFVGKEPPPAYLALHEVDDVASLDSTAARQANSTEWTKRQSDASSATIARAWKLVAMRHASDKKPVKKGSILL